MFEMFEDESSEFFEPNKLLLIDGSYAMYRAYYGYNVDSFRKKDGTPSNCIYGIAKTLLALIQEDPPTHLAICFDHPVKGRRKELLPQYKEGRTATPDELKAQFAEVKKLLAVAKITALEVERLEADDIIATLATRAEQKNWEVKIFSSDKDMYQLISSKTTILRPSSAKSGGSGRSGSRFDKLTPESFEQKYGFAHEKYPDFAALVGEQADNIPGVPGVGPKTATKWIQEYATLDDILESSEAIGGKVGVALKESAQQVRLNRKINQLQLDAEIGAELDDLRLNTPPQPAVNAFFDEWEMPSLVNRFRF
ncbi:MAG: hypothetical protein LBQ41_03990 [Candidatus Ancillula sp.]|jgi:DNA polymerase-1|nr:hypothetical protein [Candidatus Ancillula sp.]